LCSSYASALFLSHNTASLVIYTLSLHDALPIYDLTGHCDLHVFKSGIKPLWEVSDRAVGCSNSLLNGPKHLFASHAQDPNNRDGDRKSTRLNSSHVSISYAVFCLKKK